MKLATLCYIRQNNRTLMLLRNRKVNDIHHGKWNGLGGKFHPGESPEDCVTREVYEESGLMIKNPRLHGIMTFPSFSAGEDWYVFVFTASDFQGKLIDSLEGQLQWIDDNQIRSLNLWEGDRIFLKWLEQDKFFSAKFIYEKGDLKNHQVVFYDTFRKN
jgi:8-oxo-dGTP diphosphatase